MSDTKKVLIVEDDKSTGDALLMKLKEAGLDVKRAQNGEECLQFLSEEKPDIILLDVIMPGMNGIEVLKKIKEDPENKNIPVVVLTNIDTDEKVAEAIENEALDYLLKTDQTLEGIVEYVQNKLN
jgi:CheY-like chemotaxis protein